MIKAVDLLIETGNGRGAVFEYIRPCFNVGKVAEVEADSLDLGKVLR